MQSHSDRKGLSNIAYSYRILRALFSRARVLIMEPECARLCDSACSSCVHVSICHIILSCMVPFLTRMQCGSHNKYTHVYTHLLHSICGTLDSVDQVRYSFLRPIAYWWSNVRRDKILDLGYRNWRLLTWLIFQPSALYNLLYSWLHACTVGSSWYCFVIVWLTMKTENRRLFSFSLAWATCLQSCGQLCSHNGNELGLKPSSCHRGGEAYLVVRDC